MSDAIEFDPIADTIAELTGQIAKIQAAIDALESVRPFMNTRTSSTNQRGNADTNFGHDAFFGMTGADASKKFLAAIKKTASAKIIADALVSGGWKTSSKNVPENLRTILNRNSQFVVINGEFGLSEWYPGRGGGRKTRRSAQEGSAQETPVEQAPPDDAEGSEHYGE